MLSRWLSHRKQSSVGIESAGLWLLNLGPIGAEIERLEVPVQTMAVGRFVESAGACTPKAAVLRRAVRREIVEVTVFSPSGAARARSYRWPSIAGSIE